MAVEDVVFDRSYSQWEKFVQTGTISPGIRREILESWQRCMEWGVNPYDGVGRDILDTGELKRLMDQCAQLVEVARPYMTTLYQCVQGSGFMVVLTDKNSRLLHTCGDADVLDRASNQVRFIIGANWSERAVGTNAIGTTLYLGRPIQISGAEHFCLNHHNWTCSAAPVRGPGGEIIGCLDMTGPRHLAHSHTLGMIVAAVEAIENQIRKDKAQEEKNRAYELLATVTESISEGLLAVDTRGVIISINPAASIILGVTENVLGCSIDSIFNPGDNFSSAVKNLQQYTDEEVIISRDGNLVQCISSARPFFKPDGSPVGVVFTLREARKVHRLVNRMVGATARFTCKDIIGQSESMQRAKKSLLLAAKFRSNVLLLGESGTGKELFAQAIHSHSAGRNGPFVAVNCAALPRELIQSELFGYEEGAFTGAKRGGHPGKFELANGGTIFLDEIGDMPIELQVNLLRVLQERRIVRVGGRKVIPVDVRVIAASNRDLQKDVDEGKFRDDLFYRLNVFTIFIPPLRERGTDIELLTRHLVDTFAAQMGKNISGVDSGFMEAVKSYPWPGNVRELQNALEYATNVAEGKYLARRDLPRSILGAKRKPVSRSVPVRPLAELEREVVETALVQYKGNITRTARALGIGRNTLYDKMKKYQIKL